MSGTQKAQQNKEVWVPVFASGETGMTTNGRYFTRIESGRFLGGPNLRRMTWTLRRPAPGLTLLQQLLWPLIVVRWLGAALATRWTQGVDRGALDDLAGGFAAGRVVSADGERAVFFLQRRR